MVLSLLANPASDLERNPLRGVVDGKCGHAKKKNDDVEKKEPLPYPGQRLRQKKMKKEEMGS